MENTGALTKYLASHKVILMGLHASQMHIQKDGKGWDLPIDLLVAEDNREKAAQSLAKLLKGKAEEHAAVGEILPPHTDIRKDGKLLVRL